MKSSRKTNPKKNNLAGQPALPLLLEKNDKNRAKNHNTCTQELPA
jgi:hypothetical protein